MAQLYGYIRRGSPDFTNEIVDLLIDDERAAARMRYTGTHRGPLLGLAATGRAFTCDGAAFFQGRSGLLPPRGYSATLTVFGDSSPDLDECRVWDRSRGQVSTG
jgi:SnoaL-like polyketide cyclase